MVKFRCSLNHKGGFVKHIAFADVARDLIRVKKATRTLARLLTINDFKFLSGTIETLEGPAKFTPGDYLCRGAKGEEWPMEPKHFEEIKTRVTDPDSSGWAEYENTNTALATQINEEFEVTLANGTSIHGKKGDYFLVDATDKNHAWIVDSTIFQETYVEVEDPSMALNEGEWLPQKSL